MRTAPIAVVLLLAFTTPIVAADDADRVARIKAFVGRCEKERLGELKTAREALPKAKAFLSAERRSKAPRDADAQREKKERVANAQYDVEKLERAIKALEANDPPYVSEVEWQRSLRVGDIGRHPTFMKIISIVDDDEMIVHLGGPRSLDPGPFWLKGFPTKNKADGAEFNITTCIEVTGTTTYTNVAGGKATVLVIEPFDVRPFLKPAPNLKPKLPVRPREKIEDRLQRDPSDKSTR